jgi:hypothetical protein
MNLEHFANAQPLNVIRRRTGRAQRRGAKDLILLRTLRAGAEALLRVGMVLVEIPGVEPPGDVHLAGFLATTPLCHEEASVAGAGLKDKAFRKV